MLLNATYDFVGGADGSPYQEHDGTWWVNVTENIPYATDGSLQTTGIPCPSTTEGTPSAADIAAAVTAYNAQNGG